MSVELFYVMNDKTVHTIIYSRRTSKKAVYVKTVKNSVVIKTEEFLTHKGTSSTDPFKKGEGTS